MKNRFIVVATALFFLFQAESTFAKQFEIPKFESGSSKLVKEKFADLSFTGPFSKGQEFSVADNPILLPPSMSGAAVVIVPGCTGVQSYNENDMLRWSEVFLAEGYVVTIVNPTISPRPKKNCGGKKSQSASRGVKDIYDAVTAAASIDGVDKTKIFVIGFSLGAQNGAKAIWQKNIDVAVKNELATPAGVIGIYGGCQYGDGRPSKKYVYKDTILPLLWLMGGKDTEAPPKSCRVLKAINKKNKLSQSHLYKGATHCWDCKGLDGFKKKAGNGDPVIYKFDAEVTKDSEKRALSFISSILN